MTSTRRRPAAGRVIFRGNALDIEIRDEEPEDASAIRDVNEQAFGRPDEAHLVDRLRQNGSMLLSLVALVDGRVAGHILYSPITVGEDRMQGAGLAPMAVHPQFQRAGIGSMLVAEGTNRLRAAGCPLIVVLGHPGYYPRFGFVPATRFRLHCEWDVPDDVFMALPLDVSRVRTMTGVVRYSREFSTAHAG